MTHSLFGKLFFQFGNSFVTGLVSEDILRDIDRRQELINFAATQSHTLVNNDLAHFPIGPIFTFAKFDKVKELALLTGSLTLLQRLQNFIRTNGGGVSAGRSFHVPFSSGPNNYDYRYVTTHEQFVDTFGITQAQLMRGVGE